MLLLLKIVVIEETCEITYFVEFLDTVIEENPFLKYGLFLEGGMLVVVHYCSN